MRARAESVRACECACVCVCVRVHAGCSALTRVAACVRLHVWLLVGCVDVGAHRACGAEQSSVRAGVRLWGGAYAG